jgi:hypothetical protein
LDLKNHSVNSGLLEMGAGLMNTTEQSKMVAYLVICVSEFAERFKLDCKAAYRYLAAHGGITFSD